MSIELTFKSICAKIKKQGKSDPKLIESVDNILGLALICSPAVLGPSAAAVLPTLAVKNELIKIGKSIFDKLKKSKDEDYLLRYEAMHNAYGLLVFTSFFDALDTCLPDAIRKEIALLEPEKEFIAREGVTKSAEPKNSDGSCQMHNALVSDEVIVFPHPTETLKEQCERQSRLWKQMIIGFTEFIHNLAFWESADEKKKATFLHGLNKVEDVAAKFFEAQYFELSRKFEDFAIWANLQAHKGTKALIGDLSEYVKLYAKLSSASHGEIDVGFCNLREAVLKIPESLKTEQATEISDSLNRHYQARINEPIIEDKDGSDEDGPKLSFPKVCDAFVPQSFKVLRQTGKPRRLEEEATWRDLPRRNDLGAFMLSYLSSPYSTDTPMLILGHPGSGKSLLTTILSAQLMSTQFTAIRVPLREVNADADISTQIEEFIKRISGVSFDTWVKLRSQFKNCPPIVILDGYDELLQASGQVFASYIKDAQRFQQHQTEQGWPVRIIITSRVTLIDKATVPTGSTIVRLLEFDEHQRERWSEIWNKANFSYFRDSNTEKFVLPSSKERGADKILNLAEQPLLLLMLALYDSQGNQLRKNQGLDRTRLYDSLLRRFIVRERSKEKDFDNGQVSIREKALTVEMQRLGVAALGMYNRRKVHILSNELNDDLTFFKLEREVAAASGRTLSQADLLLGSFFFVHKSKANHSSGAEDNHEESSAFEFLHNTFGEFLTADFIIRRSIAQVHGLQAAEKNELLRSIVDKLMGTADGFEKDWFAGLVYTPLFTRPVILEMIREWTPHVLKEQKLSENDFVESLEKIVLNHTKRMLSKREMPQIMRKETAQEGYRVPFGDHPLVGHIAIYSINLILLRLASGTAPFIFNEAEIASHEDGTRPWDRLMYLWRSWFSLGNLNGLSAVMLADRNNEMIKVVAKQKFKAEETTSKLQEFYNVARSLGDDLSASVAGILLFNPATDSREKLKQLEDMLSSEGFDLGGPLLMAKLEFFSKGHHGFASREFVSLSRRALEYAMRSGRRDQIESVCRLIARNLEQVNIENFSVNGHALHFFDVVDPSIVVEVAMHDFRSARVLFKLGSEFHGPKWVHEFTHRFFDMSSHKLPLIERDSPHFDSGETNEFIMLLKDIKTAGVSLRNNRVREINPKAFDRMLEPNYLLEFSSRNPEAALGFLQIFQEMGSMRYFEEFLDRGVVPELVGNLFDYRYLVELSERNPERAVDYLRNLLQLGGGRYFDNVFNGRVPPGVMENLISPRRLEELSERNPERAIIYFRSLRVLGAAFYFEDFFSHPMGQELIDRIFAQHRLIELSEHNPEAAIAYLQFLSELRGDHHVDALFRNSMGEQLFERLFRLRYLADLCEYKPDRALAYLQALRHLGSGRYFEDFMNHPVESELIDRIFGYGDAYNVNVVRVELIGVWLAFARLSNSELVCSRLSNMIVEMARSRPAFISQLSGLPIKSLPDLRWLAGRYASGDLAQVVHNIMN